MVVLAVVSAYVRRTRVTVEAEGWGLLTSSPPGSPPDQEKDEARALGDSSSLAAPRSKLRPPETGYPQIVDALRHSMYLASRELYPAFETVISNHRSVVRYSEGSFV